MKAFDFLKPNAEYLQQICGGCQSVCEQQNCRLKGASSRFTGAADISDMQFPTELYGVNRNAYQQDLSRPHVDSFLQFHASNTYLMLAIIGVYIILSLHA